MKEKLLELLTALRTSAGMWEYLDAEQSWKAVVGDYTLLVTRKASWCEWEVKHERFGQLIEATPAMVSTYAKYEAVDFTRAHVLGVMEEQHLEA
jgi:hypothetical protein